MDARARPGTDNLPAGRPPAIGRSARPEQPVRSFLAASRPHDSAGDEHARRLARAGPFLRAFPFRWSPSPSIISPRSHSPSIPVRRTPCCPSRFAGALDCPAFAIPAYGLRRIRPCVGVAVPVAIGRIRRNRIRGIVATQHRFNSALYVSGIFSPSRSAPGSSDRTRFCRAQLARSFRRRGATLEYGGPAAPSAGRRRVG